MTSNITAEKPGSYMSVSPKAIGFGYLITIASSGTVM
jgi:hypothetical protein